MKFFCSTNVKAIICHLYRYFPVELLCLAGGDDLGHLFLQHASFKYSDYLHFCKFAHWAFIDDNRNVFVLVFVH